MWHEYINATTIEEVLQVLSKIGGRARLVAGGTDVVQVFGEAELYDPASGTWTVTGRLHKPRNYHTATLLENGMVVVAGGLKLTVNKPTELYDPASGTWTTTGDLNRRRFGHTATLLQDGAVLITGGEGKHNNALTSAEVGQLFP